MFEVQKKPPECIMTDNEALRGYYGCPRWENLDSQHPSFLCCLSVKLKTNRGVSQRVVSVLANRVTANKKLCGKRKMKMSGRKGRKK